MRMKNDKGMPPYMEKSIADITGKSARTGPPGCAWKNTQRAKRNLNFTPPA